MKATANEGEKWNYCHKIEVVHQLAIKGQFIRNENTNNIIERVWESNNMF